MKLAAMQECENRPRSARYLTLDNWRWLVATTTATDTAVVLRTHGASAHCVVGVAWPSTTCLAVTSQETCRFDDAVT